MQSVDQLGGESEEYMKYVISLECIQTHKTETSMWLVPKDAYLLRKAVTVVCAQGSAISFSEIIGHLESSFGERDIDKGSLRHRLGKNIYIKKMTGGLYAFQDPELLRIEYAGLLDKVEEILITENGSLELEVLIDALSDSGLMDDPLDNLNGVIKSDDRFTLLTDNLLCLN